MRVPESPCKTGFTCGVAVTVGPFCCKKVLHLQDYIVVPIRASYPADGMVIRANPRMRAAI
jgi:hypothetical protein